MDKTDSMYDPSVHGLNPKKKQQNLLDEFEDVEFDDEEEDEEEFDL